MDTEQLRRRLKLVFSLLPTYMRALVRYDWRFLEIGKRFLLALRQRFLPDEAFEEGLLNPAIPLSRVRSAVSRSRLVAFQRQVNPVQWEGALYDKGIFYHICCAAGIPVPKLFALVTRNVRGWTAAGRMPRRPAEWEEFFLRDCPSSFVAKPCKSEYGNGLFVADRIDGRFQLNDGTTVDAAGIVHKLLHDPEFDSYLIQERLHNAASLSPFGVVAGVHSFRVATLIDDDGAPRVVAADMKIITGGNIASNLAHGERGNYIAEIDLKGGRLRAVLEADVELGGYRTIVRHPETGASLEGFQIPEWNNITALALKAAAAFRPVGTIGWDIALSEHGPRIMEGNIWYSPSLSGYLTEHWLTGPPKSSRCENGPTS